MENILMTIMRGIRATASFGETCPAVGIFCASTVRCGGNTGAGTGTSVSAVGSARLVALRDVTKRCDAAQRDALFGDEESGRSLQGTGVSSAAATGVPAVVLGAMTDGQVPRIRQHAPTQRSVHRHHWRGRL